MCVRLVVDLALGYVLCAWKELHVGWWSVLAEVYNLKTQEAEQED